MKKLVSELKKLSCISLAGLRVLLSVHKAMNRQGSMTVCNVCLEFMGIFEVTCFVDILNIEG